MSLFEEFKKFIMRGNVIDLAVGVVVGGAFGKIVDSLVKDIIMPVIGVLTAGIDFSNLKIILKPADPVKNITQVSVNYGMFINNIITFLIIAVVIFAFVKFINELKKVSAIEEAKAAPPKTEVLLEEIRDLLAKK